ncbi:protein of unknown function [Rhodovastum atsumiense]|nr:hypothetical protein [Rhodovastum atsumiense]CAH2604132.1 protein of unknown function [Rhodovastum atsumiense]
MTGAALVSALALPGARPARAALPEHPRWRLVFVNHVMHGKEAG